MKHPKLLPALLAVVIALLGAVTVALVDTDGDGTPDAVTITQKKPREFVQAPGPTGPVAVDRDQELQPDEQREQHTESRLSDGQAIIDANGEREPVAHEDQRDETPPGVPAGKAKDGLEDQTAQGLVRPEQPAGAQGYSCPQRIVRNYSSRAGQRVLLFVLHFTVSPPGSLPGIRNQFNTSSSGTSSTFGMEVLTGRCEQWVPFSGKPWTQGNFNGRSESIEIVSYDRSRAEWLASGIFTRGYLANLVRDRMKARGLPLRLVDPSGCGVQAAGVTDHDRLECGNSHYDVGRNFPWDVFMRQLRGGTVALDPRAKLRPDEKRIASRRCYHYRARAKAKAGTAQHAAQVRYSRLWKRRAGQRKGHFDNVRRAGKPWSYHSMGTRRKLMSQTERLTRADRRVVCA